MPHHGLLGGGLSYWIPVKEMEKRRMQFRLNESIRIVSSRKFYKLLCHPVPPSTKVYGVSLTSPWSTHMPFPTPVLLNAPELPAWLEPWIPSNHKQVLTALFTCFYNFFRCKPHYLSIIPRPKLYKFIMPSPTENSKGDLDLLSTQSDICVSGRKFPADQ